MSQEEQKIRQFLSERFGNYRTDIGPTDSLDDVVDSLGLFELVEFVEREFFVSIPNEEFSPQRFSSIERIIHVIEEFRVQ